MDRLVHVVGAVAAVLTLSACTESGSPVPATSPVTISSALSPEQQDNLRIVERLAELGCDTSGCIQTYFACKDGYLTGEACDFYRKNPM